MTSLRSEPRRDGTVYCAYCTCTPCSTHTHTYSVPYPTRTKRFVPSGVSLLARADIRACRSRANALLNVRSNREICIALSHSGRKRGRRSVRGLLAVRLGQTSNSRLATRVDLCAFTTGFMYICMDSRPMFNHSPARYRYGYFYPLSASERLARTRGTLASCPE